MKFGLSPFTEADTRPQEPLGLGDQGKGIQTRDLSEPGLVSGVQLQAVTFSQLSLGNQNCV